MSETVFDAEQLRRTVVQQLEGMRRAGVTHWKQIEPVTVAVAATTTTAVAASTTTPVMQQSAKTPAHQGATATVLADTLVPDIGDSDLSIAVTKVPMATSVVAKQILVGESEDSQLAKKRSSTTGPALTNSSCASFQPLDLPLAARVAGLKALAERVCHCTRCPELATTRTQTVFGIGNPEAKILFVGEAPGADEDVQGEPFVGKCGQLLNDIIKACRIRREDIYICNVLRCRPPGNRLPAPEEAANCREYLDGQIAHVNPEYIVCWGACAAQNLLGSTETIGKLRRRFFTYGKAKVLCTYHPAYLMRNPAAKKDVWEDMKMLFLDMGVDLAARG